MTNIKSIIADNIASLRLKAGMTQLQLAEKLNYSDKAISKWERGESVPDISVLKQIADTFGVTVDHLITEHFPGDEAGETGACANSPGDTDGADGANTPCREKSEKESERRSKLRNHLLIGLISISAAWLIAIVLFVFLWVSGKGVYPVIFVSAVPVSALLLLIFNSVRGVPGRKRFINYMSITVLMWSLFTVLFLFLKIWQLFLIPIPGQAILTFAIFIESKKAGSVKNGGTQ